MMYFAFNMMNRNPGIIGADGNIDLSGLGELCGSVTGLH